MESKNYSQIDILKGLAIISVLTLHSTSSEMHSVSFAVFHIIQAVPIFTILLGINMAMSYNRKGYSSLWQMFNREYFFSRFWRVFFPFLMFFLIDIVVGLIIQMPLYFGEFTYIGVLPYSGPGNFFISILFQFVFLFPFLYYLYKFNPKVMLLLSFLVNLLFEIIAPYVDLFSANITLYSFCILRYLFAISLGIYFAKDVSDPQNFLKKNRFMYVGFIASITYLLAFSVFSFNFNFILHEWGSQNIFSFFYPLLLVFLGIKFLPENPNNKLARFFTYLGKNSFHIFLVQIIFFRTIILYGWPVTDVFLLVTLPIKIAICVVFGSLLKILESFVSNNLRKRFSNFRSNQKKSPDVIIPENGKKDSEKVTSEISDLNRK